MHILSCRVQDELRIGHSTSVTILDVAGDHVRLGVSTPGQIPEYQEEVIYLADAADPAPRRIDDSASADEQLVEV